MAQTQERGGHAADSPWSLAYEQLMLSQLHAYCMYLEVATYTTQDARKADSLAHTAHPQKAQRSKWAIGFATSGSAI